MIVKKLYLDTETTGRDAAIHGIIQLAAILEVDGERVDTFDSLMRPADKILIEDEALLVSGITREQIAAAEPELKVFRSFLAWLGRSIDKYNKADKAFLVGYNVAFDDAFLRALAERCGEKYLGSYKWPDLIDVRQKALETVLADRHTFPNFQLGTVAKALLSSEAYAAATEAASLHNAMTDIELTYQLDKAVSA